MGESTTDFNAADTVADTVAELVRSLPQFADANIVVQPIDAGMTNKNFKVLAGDQAFVARMPGRDTELLGIERSSEMVATIRAANLGVGPAVVAELPQMSTLLCEWLQAEVATEQSILEPGALERVAQAIRVLHDGAPLTHGFPIFDIPARHAADAASRGIAVPAVYRELEPVIGRLRAAFDPASLVATPCHNDLLPANVMVGAAADGSPRCWLIDFEYSGMNHYLFDLANLSINCALDDAADRRLFDAYFGGSGGSRLPPAIDQVQAQFRIMKIMSEVREGMWGVVQQAISDVTTVDFVQYADDHLNMALSLASTDDLDDVIAAASR